MARWHRNLKESKYELPIFYFEKLQYIGLEAEFFQQSKSRKMPALASWTDIFFKFYNHTLFELILPKIMVYFLISDYLEVIGGNNYFIRTISSKILITEFVQKLGDFLWWIISDIRKDLMLEQIYCFWQAFPHLLDHCKTFLIQFSVISYPVIMLS